MASREALGSVARGNPKPCLPRPCTLRLKGRVPWRRLIRRIFPAPTRLLRCRRPYAGVSRSPRRTAKRAASPCRSENEAAGAQGRGRPGPWTRTWGCCCGGGRQPPSACTPAAQKQFTLGRLSPQPWSPGAQSPNLLLTMVTKLWGRFRVGQITPGHCWQTHGGPCQAFPPSKWPESSTHGRSVRPQGRAPHSSHAGQIQGTEDSVRASESSSQLGFSPGLCVYPYQV